MVILPLQMMLALPPVVVKNTVVVGDGGWWQSLVAGLAGALLTAIATWYLAPRISRRQRVAERREEALLKIQAAADLRLPEILSTIKVGSQLLVPLSELEAPDWEPDEELVEREKLWTARTDKSCRELDELLAEFGVWDAQAGDLEIHRQYSRLYIASVGFRMAIWRDDLRRRLLDLHKASEDVDKLREACLAISKRALLLLGHSPPKASGRIGRWIRTVSSWLGRLSARLPKRGERAGS